jgi:Tfp pilus assembly protein PilN
MSATVNLVPRPRLVASLRRRRRRGWMVCHVTVGLLIASAWSVQQMARAALQRVELRTATMKEQVTAYEQRLVESEAERSALIERLRVIAAARCPQPWGQRLVDLTRALPAGVVLSEVEVTAASEARASDAGAGRRSAGRTVSPQLAPGPADSGGQSVRLVGLALDHAALMEMLHAVRKLPGWRQVELVHAQRQPSGATQVIAFEFRSQTGEVQP